MRRWSGLFPALVLAVALAPAGRAAETPKEAPQAQALRVTYYFLPG